VSAAESINAAILEELRAIRAELQAQREHRTVADRVMLTRTEAADLLGIERHRLGRLILAGQIKAVECGKRSRIPRTEIDRIAREGLPEEAKRRGRPRKARAGSVGAAIMALPIRSTSASGRGEG